MRPNQLAVLALYLLASFTALADPRVVDGAEEHANLAQRSMFIGHLPPVHTPTHSTPHQENVQSTSNPGQWGRYEHEANRLYAQQPTPGRHHTPTRSTPHHSPTPHKITQPKLGGNQGRLPSKRAERHNPYQPAPTPRHTPTPHHTPKHTPTNHISTPSRLSTAHGKTQTTHKPDEQDKRGADGLFNKIPTPPHTPHHTSTSSHSRKHHLRTEQSTFTRVPRSTSLP